MQHLLCTCVFVPLRFCTILLPKAEAKTIFLINCRSNLTINIVKRGKEMKNEWLTMPTLTKENFIFDSKLSPGWFSVAEGVEVDAHDWNQGNWKGNILKSGHEKLTDFCGTCHGKSFFQLVVTLYWLQFFKGRYKPSKYSFEKHICIGYCTSKSTSFPNSWFE